jgi:RND superfamily putative drug exporter
MISGAPIDGSSIRRSRLVVGLFIAAALLGGSYGLGVQSVLKAGGLVDAGSDSSRARGWLHEALEISQPDIVAVFSSSDLRATDSEFFDQIEPILDRLAANPDVESVHSFFDTGQLAMISQDESRAALFLSLRGDDTAKSEALTRLRPVLHASDLDVELGGTLPAEVYAQETAFRDLERGELVALPLVAGLLLLFFRGVIAAMLPVAVALFAIPTALASLRLLTHWMDVSIFALNVASFIGIGLAIDYALLVVTRFREELAAGRSIEESVERTMETAGRSILVSGITVAASLAALLVFPLVILRTIGIAGILVVLGAMIGALLFLPHLLRLLGGRIGSHEDVSGAAFGRWIHGLAESVMKRPVLLTLATLLFLAALGTPVLRMKSTLPDVHVFPPEAEVRRVDEMLESSQGFGKTPLTPILVAVRAPSSFEDSKEDSEDLGTLIALTKAIANLPGVDRVASPFAQGRLADPGVARSALDHPESLDPMESQLLSRSMHDDLSVIYVYGTAPWRSNEAAELVRTIRELPAPGLEVAVGGPTAENLDGRTALVDGLPMAIGLLLFTNIVILFMAFGSVVLPFKAVAMNIASLSASFGALVWIFQDGHLARILRFDPPGGIDVTVPVVLLAVTFGLSMDYEIFLLSRIKEEFDRTGDNARSVAVGLEHTSTIISRAAILLIAVVAAFAFGELIFVKEIGVGMVIAVAIDATIVRCILVPSTMQLLGNLNWWAPKILKRLWRPLLHEGNPSDPAAR